MRRYPLRTLTATAAGLLILSGCSSTTETSSTTGSPSVSATPSTSSSGGSGTPTSVAPGEVGVSRDGVTTAVGAPAESTEDDYFQACRAARTWMDKQGGEPRTQLEPYLKTIQSADSLGPSTFGRPWSELSPGQQAAVIVAVEAAVDGLCG